ncbi:MAG: redoxin domain-containing protein [Candidatus Dojkabacteria bacterium]|uniref:AhpC/TSA family protein n=1 Tax=candidate division WS6 bacterium OLB21 TaxID=1617427 RepID=A0A136KE72_9BACT|nr:MAG: AhpC/TSA family protein [candidate division WS6 bacterium OLB21]WKZ28226.1 MAG: redoxin domain-containing protein [Candidatus Dojkabacteria bacterium]
MPLLNTQNQSLGFIAKDFMLSSSLGDFFLLSDFLNKQALLIVFISQSDANSLVFWPYLIDLYEKYSSDLNLIAVNSNDPIKSPSDHIDSLRKFTLENSLKFPYLVDSDQTCALSYNAQYNPENFLFRIKQTRAELFFKGNAVDNIPEPFNSQVHYLRNEIDQLLSGKEPINKKQNITGTRIVWK